ncbi:MAG: NAD-dependent dehydratase [Lysobacteraceae bacterium]|nr:MAG: NAD-dependent dehydratase [Xanthomonadaceae bacterium]
MRLLIVGASGLVGRHALELALADGRIERVIAPVRRPIKVESALDGIPKNAAMINSSPGDSMPEISGFAASKLETPIVDYERLPADAPWWEVDAVICTLGTTMRQAGSRAAFRRVDLDYVQMAAECAQRHGAYAFALNSSLGADHRSRASYYLRIKGETEQVLRKLGFLSLTIVRPSVIDGQRERRRPLEHASMRLLRAVGPLIPRRYRVVPAEAIAQALLEAAITAEPGCHCIESEQLLPA